MGFFDFLFRKEEVIGNGENNIGIMNKKTDGIFRFIVQDVSSHNDTEVFVVGKIEIGTIKIRTNCKNKKHIDRRNKASKR